MVSFGSGINICAVARAESPMVKATSFIVEMKGKRKSRRNKRCQPRPKSMSVCDLELKSTGR